MSLWPQISLRRTLLIARRDFIGYVKTLGFWISVLTPFIIGAVAIFAATTKIDLTPARYVTILDLTEAAHAQRVTKLIEEDHQRIAKSQLRRAAKFLPEKDERALFESVLTEQGYEAGLAYFNQHMPAGAIGEADIELPFILVRPPADNFDDLMPYLRGERDFEQNGERAFLSGAIIFRPTDSVETGENVEGGFSAQYWSMNFNEAAPSDALQRYMNRLAAETYFSGSGLSREGFNAALQNAEPVQIFNPAKSTQDGSQIVTLSDRIPYLVAAGMAVLLWLSIFSGSYMLLTSMLEEKLNKLLEAMLASTRFSEIIFGKLLGVAALTLAIMSPYILIGAAGVISYIVAGPDPDIVQGLADSFSAKIFIFLLIYLVLGYVLYGAFFIALGALSSSTQDAQTLTTPIILILTVCLMVVPLGVSTPDSPLLIVASFIPFSAPFAAIIRLPSDPPLWQLILSAAGLFIMCIGVVAAAARVFRHGILSGGTPSQGLTRLWRKIRRKA